MVQQHERQQPRHVRLVGDRVELAGQPDGLRRQIGLPAVTLVEDQVEHPQNSREIAGFGEPGVDETTLGAADPLPRRISNPITPGTSALRRAGSINR